MPEQQPDTASGGVSTLRTHREQTRRRRAEGAPPPAHTRNQPVPLTPVADGAAPTGAAPAPTGAAPAPTDAEPEGSFWAPIDEVAPNPRNTRETLLHPERVAELASQIKRDGQMHASPVATRAAYLKIFPEDTELIGKARWVQGPGARRRAAQVLNGSPVIKVEIQNDLAASRDKWLETTFSENFDRENLDPIEEARAVEQLVREAGSAAEVGRRRKRSDAWVFQKLNLLHLHADVQAQLRADGDARLPVRVVRDWHKMSESAQLTKLTAWRRQNDPTYVKDAALDEAAQEPGKEKPARPSRFRGTFDKMGNTPAERAHSLVLELTEEERDALRRELGGDPPNRG